MRIRFHLNVPIPNVTVTWGRWEFCFTPFYWSLYRARLIHSQATSFGFCYHVGPFWMERAPR